METVCSTCGEQNPPETQFCWSCRAYLGWQDDSSSSRTPPVTGPTPVIVPTPDEPPPSAGSARADRAGGADEWRDPFETGIEVEDLTVPVDGTPVTVTVNLTNTSSVVDGYVVEGLNAPPWLEVRPGTTELMPSASGAVTADLRIVSPTLVPAQKLVLLVRLRNTTGRFAYRDMSVRVTVPVVEAPFQVRAEPQLIRTRDHSPGVCTVVVENPRSNRWSRVRLSAADPEQAVRATWRLPELDVPPGGEARTDVRFEAPPPNPGSEASRTITITATEGQQRAETTVTLTQSASRAAIELLALRLDPTVLRLGGRHRGQMTAVVDNRGGATPVSLSLRGDDPENSLGFAFSPGHGPGAGGAAGVGPRHRHGAAHAAGTGGHPAPDDHGLGRPQRHPRRRQRDPAGILAARTGSRAAHAPGRARDDPGFAADLRRRHRELGRRADRGADLE